MTALRSWPGFAHRHRTALRLSLCYFAVFAVFGVNLPFWPVWLRAQGLQADQIGLMLALALWVKLLANPIVTSLADRFGGGRPALILMAAFATVGFALFWPDRSFLAILAVTALANIFYSALTPLTDSTALQLIRTAPPGERSRFLQYGRVRLWGSLSFILASALTGWLVQGRSADWILAMMVLGLASATLAALALPRPWPEPRPVTAPARLPLLRQKGLWVVLAAASLIQASHGLFYGFSALHWRAAGLGEGVIGALWAEGVIAEILLFALGARIVRRFGAETLLLIGGLSGILRWTATAFSSELWLLAILQLLHAATFGATHLATIDYLGRTAPAGRSATAQGFYAALSAAMLSTSVLLSGTLYQRFGGHAFLAMAGICVLGSVIARLGAVIPRRA